MVHLLALNFVDNTWLIISFRYHFSGANCENETNECLSTPCKNNAECIDLVANFECKCQPGYFGELCQIDINECLDLPCANGATCFDKVNDYQCICVAGRFSNRCCSP